MEQHQDDSQYPHVLALTCEDESCNLRCLPPIPLQTEEDTTSMAARRRNILTQPEQFATDRLALVAQRSTVSSKPEKEEEPLGAQQRRNRSPFEDEAPHEQQQQSDTETDPGCDERGYELPYSRIGSNSRSRKRSMSVQLPCLSKPFEAAVDRGNWNARFQQVIEFIFRIGLNTHTSLLFNSLVETSSAPTTNKQPKKQVRSSRHSRNCATWHRTLATLQSGTQASSSLRCACQTKQRLSSRCPQSRGSQAAKSTSPTRFCSSLLSTRLVSLASLPPSNKNKHF